MATTVVPLFPGIPGGIELVVILLIVVLLFGANKLPQLAKSSGQAMGEFQKGREEVEQELQQMREGGNADATADATDDDAATTTTTTTDDTATATQADSEPATETEAEKQN